MREIASGAMLNVEGEPESVADLAVWVYDSDQRQFCPTWPSPYAQAERENDEGENLLGHIWKFYFGI